MSPPGSSEAGRQVCQQAEARWLCHGIGAGQSGDCRRGPTEPGCLGPPRVDRVPRSWPQLQECPPGPAGDRPRLSLQTLWVVLGVVCGPCPLACAGRATVLVLTYESLLCVYVCPACLAFSVSFGNDTRYNHSLPHSLGPSSAAFQFPISSDVSPRSLPLCRPLPSHPFPWIFVLNDLCDTARPPPTA